jgi:superfamily II DNA or RNA helicase/HKD family nuclease
MALIDNKNQTLQDALKNALTTADSVDIAVGFFYFSGFQALFDQLKQKKVRILVGLEVDPDLVPLIAQYSKNGDEDLSRWQPRRPTTSRTSLKLNYIDSFVGFMNDSDIFDDDQTNEIFDLYIQKINDGSLEIRKTVSDYHGKFYIVHNREDVSQNGDFPGTVFMGSSNLTFRGLIGQGELNDSTREKSKFEEYQAQFEHMWSDSKSISIADAATKDEFLDSIRPRIWKYNTPLPYHVYIRILHELFNQEALEILKTPQVITHGLYTDLEYQIDAIKMVMDKLNKYNGAILADVVGLGKSIIASAVARNMDLKTDIKTVIIAPPHLIPQWEEYKEEFGIRGSKVYSSGKISEVYERYHDARDPMLYILDEAHRYRNEDTGDYKLLHQVCRSHPQNKILLLTATPFNNDPKDVFALIKLFQTPGQSTIRSVDNLSLRYRELIRRYNKLRRYMTKDIDQDFVDQETAEIAAEQRRLIETVIIRRSRLDLNYITRYREDLERQHIAFAEVRGPDLLEYDLGELFEPYMQTLDLIIKPDNEGFIGARYKPTSETYMNSANRKKFIDKYKSEFDDIEDVRIAQLNLASFMRRLLVMRFESSRDAFRSTLDKMIESNKLIEHWWDTLGVVPIMKKGQLPDPQDFDMADGEPDALKDELELLRSNKGLLEISKDLLEPQFIEDVRHDTQLLQSIRQDWYANPEYANLDPKLDNIMGTIQGLLSENPQRKIVIFSSYKDTVDYVYKKMVAAGFDRVMSYTASEATNENKKIIRQNFDASLPESRQANNFDVLIATDALSEGFNLHRAGIVINYDIPYNPTRVIQRVGRINRINKKVFDFIYIYNCFPTIIGEEETRVKTISTLKMKLINAVVGSDTKTLTKDEELVSFFKDEFDIARREDEQVSWDAFYREAYDKALKDTRLIQTVQHIPRRSRIKRLETKAPGVVVFGKKGQNSIFTFGDVESDVKVISSEEALPFFAAKPDEKGKAVDKDFTALFTIAKDKLFAKHELPQIKGRRQSAITVLKVIAKDLPIAKDYCEDIISIIRMLDDISDGSLKDISQLDLRNIEDAYKELKQIIPDVFVRNILNRAQSTEDEEELLLFAEQLI